MFLRPHGCVLPIAFFTHAKSAIETEGIEGRLVALEQVALSSNHE
jgi:hypothetical protein